MWFVLVCLEPGWDIDCISYVFDSPTRTRIASSSIEVIPHQDFNFTSFIDDVMSMIPSSSHVNEACITQTDSNCLSTYVSEEKHQKGVDFPAGCGFSLTLYRL